MAKVQKRHGNSLKNNAPHHLYEIRDAEENDVLKYGISHDAIEDDELSKRLRDQVNLFNIGVGILRFFARILIKNIPGRVEALKIELNSTFLQTKYRRLCIWKPKYWSGYNAQ